MGNSLTEPLLRKCLFCRTPFPLNHTVEHIAVGRRVAFDPKRGRLWIVCAACGRWNLAPLETRWEALDELERLTGQHARLLAKTDHIALLEAGLLQVVRVGASTLREEAWWRYGDQFFEREGRAARARKRGNIMDAVLAAAVIGIPLWGWRRSDYHVERLRRGEYGAHAWRDRLQCARCGALRPGIAFEDAGKLRLDHDGGGAIRLWLSCDRCDQTAEDAGFMLSGAVAEHVLRRVLAYENFAGAPEWEIVRAAGLVTDAGSAAAFTINVAASGTDLDSLPPEQSLALEIAINDECERQLLTLEAASLEQRWLEEERIAAIVDAELS